MHKSNASLTEGSVSRTLVAFAVPFLLANFVQALYGAVDMAVVGWFDTAETIAAVSIGTQVMQILSSLISGLTVGGTILIAQYCGAQKREDTSQTIGTMLTLFGGAALVFMAVMLVGAPMALRLLQTPAEAFNSALSYVRVCSCGILFIFGYNSISAVLRGMGNSRSPLIFITIACLTNIVLDVAFVGALHLGAGGAALATVLSQGLSMVLAVVYLKNRDFIFDFKLKSFRVDKAKALRITQLGLPVSLQETLLSVSFLFITAIINSLGVVATAAVGIAGKFENFAMLPAGAFSGAISSIAAQNIGAGKPERAKRSLELSILFSFLCSLFFFAWAQISPESVLGMFRADPEVLLAGGQYLRSFSFDFMLVAFGFCLNGFFNGCGRTTFSMLNGITASLLIRVPLAFILSRALPDSLFGIGFAAPAATIVSVVASLVYMRMGRWKKAVI